MYANNVDQIRTDNDRRLLNFLYKRHSLVEHQRTKMKISDEKYTVQQKKKHEVRRDRHKHIRKTLQHTLRKCLE